MRILVIGGTYFWGKAFVEIAGKENEIVLMNRGSQNVSFRYPEHISTVICDRFCHGTSEDGRSGKKPPYL